MTTSLHPPQAPGAALPKRPAPGANTIAVSVVLVGLLGVSIWSVVDLQINLASIVDSIGNAADFLSRVFPLDFPSVGDILAMVGTTLAIVICATVLSVLLSLPIALLAAANTTPVRGARPVARAIIVLARAVPDLVLAIFFFRLFGLGALPGILALGLHSVGMIGKLYADAIEQIDEGPRDAIRSAGGGRLQQITGGILPQVMPQLIATALHRFDINLRTSVLLGYVGVGGIGLEISNAFRSLNYSRGMALAVIVLAMCIITELISGAIRTALLGRSTKPRGRLTRWADSVSGGWVSGGKQRVTPPWTGQRPRAPPT